MNTINGFSFDIDALRELAASADRIARASHRAGAPNEGAYMLYQELAHAITIFEHSRDVEAVAVEGAQ